MQEQFKGLSPEELKDNLESLCVSSQESIIRRELSHEERTMFQQELAKSSIDLAIKNENFDQIKQDHKTETQPIKLDISEFIKNLRTNSIEEEGMIYDIANQESGNMESYDTKGNLIQMRPLLPEERQRSLIHDSLMTTSKAS